MKSKGSTLAAVLIGIAVGGVAVGAVTLNAARDAEPAVSSAESDPLPAAPRGAAAEVAPQQAQDNSMTPWNDPDDPYVILLNRDDPTVTEWNARNPGRDPTRAAGPIDLHRYSGGTVYDAFPTFLSMPVAFTPEDLQAGDIDVAIVWNNSTGGTWENVVSGGELYQGPTGPTPALDEFYDWIKCRSSLMLPDIREGEGTGLK